MFDVGWSEMALVLLVALIVIGPKDLPRVARTVGQWVGKGRAMAREFQRALEDMAREAELDKVKSEIEKAGRTNLGKTIEKTIDPSGELSKAFDPKADGRKANSVTEAGGTTVSGARANGDQPAGVEADQAQAASPPAAPAEPAESHPPSGNGASAARVRKKPTRRAAAAPAKLDNPAPAGNGAGAAEDTKEPARETAPAEN
jgi:sec-independent protein translocase protein TatB